VTVHHRYNNINSQLDATITDFINNFKQLNMFRAKHVELIEIINKIIIVASISLFILLK